MSTAEIISLWHTSTIVFLAPQVICTACAFSAGSVVPALASVTGTKLAESGKAVVLHDGLAEHEARVVCAHELGHVLLHPKLNRIYLDTSTFVCERKLENEVNAFAVCLLYPDDSELLENCSTLSEMSVYMGVRLELAQLRSTYIGM